MSCPIRGRAPVALLLAFTACVVACTDDASPPAADPPTTTTTTSTTTTIPPDAVVERTQMILTIDGPTVADPNALSALATAIRDRFIAAGSGDTRTTVIGERVVVDAPAELDNLDVYAFAATRGGLDFRPVLAELPTCPSPLPPPGDDQPSILRLRDQGEGCAHVGPTAPVTIDRAQALVDDDRWVVSVRLTPEGRSALSQMFAACFAKDVTCPTATVATAFDDTIESSAQVETPTYDKPVVQLSGNFDGMEAMRIATVLAAPPLPSDVRVIEPPVLVQRRVVGRAAATGECMAVIIRLEADVDARSVVEGVGAAMAGQMTLLGATAVFVSADVQLGELTAVVVGAKDPTAAAGAVVTAAGIEDASRVVTVAARVP